MHGNYSERLPYTFRKEINIASDPTNIVQVLSNYFAKKINYVWNDYFYNIPHKKKNKTH